MKYTDLIFDLYGTLVDIRTEENRTVWKKTALYFGYYGIPYTAQALKADFQAALAMRQAQAGQSYECFPDIPIEEIFSQLAGKKCPDTFGVQAAQLFRICSTKYIRLYPGVPEALQALRSQGCRIWLLSNAQRVFTAFELEHLRLQDVFDGIYISSDYGCRKPDQRFFGSLLQKEGLDVNTCLMIGNDRLTDIAGAQKAGLATLYLHSNITPADQAPADPALHPLSAPRGCRHFELNGTNWHKIYPLLGSI